MKTGTLETGTGSDVTSHDGFFGQLRIAITGGTSGLGLALVREFSARGARVAFLARHAEPVAKVERENKNTHGIVADVSDKDAIYPAALQILGELGGLEILINNASDLGAVPLALLADTNCEDLEKAVATNVLGPFRLTKALLARGVVSGGSRGSSSPGDQYLQRCGSDALSKMGSLRRQQGRPPPPDRNLESGIIGRGRTVSLF